MSEFVLYDFIEIGSAEASVFGKSLVGIAGSNSAGGMHVCLL